MRGAGRRLEDEEEKGIQVGVLCSRQRRVTEVAIWFTSKNPHDDGSWDFCTSRQLWSPLIRIYLSSANILQPPSRQRAYIHCLFGHHHIRHDCRFRVIPGCEDFLGGDNKPTIVLVRGLLRLHASFPRLRTWSRTGRSPVRSGSLNRNVSCIEQSG